MKTINWIGNDNSHEGYGYHNLKLLEAVGRLGNGRYKTVPLSADQLKYWPTWMLNRAGIDLANPLVIVGQPHWYELERIPGRIWLHTMYESTQIPTEWVRLINKHVERVIVPCPWNYEIFRRNGIYVPIHVVEEGVDARDYPLITEDSLDRPYTFMCLGDRSSRKNFGAVWVAFCDHFTDDDNVRLITKSRTDNLDLFEESKVEPRNILLYRYDAPDMKDIYAMADCFVFPTKGEGAGLPPREATSMGIPSIATAFSGTYDVSNWGIPLTEYKMMPSAMKGGGDWAHVDTEHLGEKMRWCYEHRNEAKAIALKGAKWLRENWTWNHAAKNFLELFDRHM